MRELRALIPARLRSLRGAGRRRAACAGAGMLCLLAAAPAAWAEGGTTIAGATPVVFGQQEFGNTANGGQGQPGCDSVSGATYRSWWAIGVTAGDELTVDWETQSSDMYMNLFQVGTTDFNVEQTSPVAQEQVNSNFKNEATYTAIQTGTMPLEFFSDTGCGNDPAPYDLTAYVKHAVRLSVPVLASLPLQGQVAVGVHNPDGAGITDPSLGVALQIHPAHQPWVTIGSAAPSAGTATIPYSISPSLAGARVTLRAVAAGSAYVTETSGTQTSIVPAAAPVHHGHHKHHKHHRHHRHHRRRRHRHA